MRLIAAALLGALFITSPAMAGVILTPNPGYAIGYNGNDGNFFSAANPAPAPAAPANKARTAGVTAFGSSEYGAGVHLIANINDGLYGNSNSWLSNFPLPDTNPYIGLNLAANPSLGITSIAWGRDNGNNVELACGGQCTDRSIGVYTLQRTTVAVPGVGTTETGLASTGWENIGTIEIQGPDVDGVAGGGFTTFLRHEYTLSLGGSPVPATGLRIKVSDPNLALDELEVYAVPEPSTLLLGLAGLVGLAVARRRQAA